MNKIIFGGAFDPIHNGHIEMAVQTSKVLDADVIFVPSKNAVWKESLVGKEHKKKMVELAIKPYSRFSICDYELDAPESFVYSIDTAKYIKSLYPNDNIYLLIGYDQANLFHRWRSAKELSKLVKIVVYKRPDYDVVQENVDEYEMMVINDKEVHYTSSTEIREFRVLDVPYEVINYIEQNDLYYIPRLKKWYGDRYEHVLGTANVAYKIAKSNKKDAGKAYIAGFLHDLGKVVNIYAENEDHSEEFESLKNEYSKYASLPKYALHQVLGAFYAKRDYKIEDESMLNSILFHCTGNEKMDWLEKTVYASDKIEPSRGYDSTDLINAMCKDIDEGFLTVLKANMSFINGKAVKGSENFLTIKCCEYYLKQE